MNRDDLGEAGREAWDQAHSTEWATPPDEGAILHLCRLEDEAVTLVEGIQAHGAVQSEPIVSPRGDVVGTRWVAHPLVGELRKLDAVLLKLRSSLGLDPESRAKMGLDLIRPDDRPDKLDELVEERRQRRAAVANGTYTGESWPGSHNGHKR